MKISCYSENNLEFIKVSKETFSVTFCNLGASLYSVCFNNKEMLMTLKDSKDFLRNDLYHGKTIGRTPCRIKGNLVEIAGKTYEILPNENGNVLHGGTEGLSTKFFNYSIKENKNNIKVIFNYSSKDKDGGFPGLLKVKIIYVIPNNGSKIKVKFEANTSKPTLCGFTNHAFFNLGESCVEDLLFKVKSSNYLKTTEDELIPVSKEPIFKELIFNRFKKLGKSLHSKKIEKGKANGYDHYFYFDEPTKKPQVFLKSGTYLLKIKTDFEGVQIYTDNYPDGIKWINTNRERNRSIAIEPMDNYLHRKVLYPKEKYSRYIEYEFKCLVK